MFGAGVSGAEVFRAEVVGPGALGAELLAFGRLIEDLRDLHVRQAKLRERVAQRLFVILETVAETLDERPDGVDRQGRLGEIGRSFAVDTEVQDGELPEPDGVVRDDVEHRGRGELRPHLSEFFGRLLLDFGPRRLGRRCRA